MKVKFGEGEGKIPLDVIAEKAKKYWPKPKIIYKMIQEYVEKKYGFNLMKESILQIAKQINQLQQKAYNIYFSLVEDVREQEVLEDELSHLLDYLSDVACDEKILVLDKRICRKYL